MKSLFSPDLYFKKVQLINFEILKENNIDGIAIDVDNTLIDYTKVLNIEVINWINDMKERGLKICILSNSNNKEKILSVANALNLEYIMSAQKPLKKGFKKAINKLELPSEKIAVIGDQVFTDVLGANRMKMFSIYVEPINKKEYWYTRWKRPLENIVKNRFKAKQNNKNKGEK